MIPVSHHEIFPFSLLHHPLDVPVGIYTNRQRWSMSLSNPLEYTINDLLIPSSELLQQVNSLEKGEALFQGDTFLIGKSNEQNAQWKIRQITSEIQLVQNLSDLLQMNKKLLVEDINSLKDNNKLLPSVNGVQVNFPSQLFVEQGAELFGAMIDTSGGPVYISAGCKIMAGSCIRGPVYFGPNCLVKMGGTIYGPCAFQSDCVLNGEINRSFFMIGVNKGHEGYIGDSIIGTYCNLGALTSCSNLKNNFSDISLYNYNSNSLQPSGLQKCGIFMGDYSRTAVMTKFASGTIVGVSANIASSGWIAKYIPSFTWLTDDVQTQYRLEPALKAIQQLHTWKNIPIQEEEINRLKSLWHLCVPKND